MYHFVHAHIKFSVDKFSVCEMKNSKRVMSLNFWYFSVFHMNFLLLMNQFRNMNALWVNVCYWWNQIKQGLWQGSVHIQEHELIFLKFLQPMLNTITFPIFIPVFFFTASTQITQQQWSSFVQAWMYVSMYQNEDSWHIYLHFQH